MTSVIEVLIFLVFVFTEVQLIKYSIFMTILPTFFSLSMGNAIIKDLYDIKNSSNSNKEMLKLLENSIDKLESELTSLKDKKLESKELKEYNVVKNVDEKEKLFDLKEKLELYSEYIKKKRKYDRLNEKGKLKYKLQKNYTNHEIEIIENFSNAHMGYKQKVKKYGEYNALHDKRRM